MTLLLHDQTRAQLVAITATRTSSYIFHGAAGIGKGMAARELARQLNCQGQPKEPCTACAQFESNNYPDYIVVQPEDKPSIVIEQIRNLIQSLSLQPYYQAGTRFVIIDQADHMTVEAQNALLKLIEEPPSRTLFILIAEQTSALLPTVRSRCAAIYFPRLADDAVAELLINQHGLPSVQADEIATAVGGVPGLAINLVTRPELASGRLELSRLASKVLQQTPFERLLTAAKLATAKTDLLSFSHLLHAQIITSLRNDTVDTTAAAQGLIAIQQFRQQLQAKVSPRVAAERLMLEL